MRGKEVAKAIGIAFLLLAADLFEAALSMRIPIPSDSLLLLLFLFLLLEVGSLTRFLGLFFHLLLLGAVLFAKSELRMVLMPSLWLSVLLLPLSGLIGRWTDRQKTRAKRWRVSLISWGIFALIVALWIG